MASFHLLNFICTILFISIDVCTGERIEGNISCNFKDGLCDGWYSDPQYYDELEWKATQQSKDLNISTTRPGQIVVLEVPDEANEEEVENCLYGYLNGPRVSIEGKFKLHLTLFANIMSEFSYIYVYLTHYHPNDVIEYQYMPFPSKNTQGKWVNYTLEDLESKTDISIQVEGRLCFRPEKIAIEEIIVSQE